jgi:sugar-specific transcriptional regulator TrmB
VTQEWMIKTLVSLGLSHVDAEIYVFLSTQGSHKGRSIAETLKLYKQQLYRSLKRLKTKRLIYSSTEHPAVYSSVSFDEVLDLFWEIKTEEADLLQENREEILSKWQSITKKDNQS